MTFRQFQSSGVTAEVNVQPNDGYMWYLIKSYLEIDSSATAGTRTLVLKWRDYEAAEDFQDLLTVSGTTVSGVINGQLSSIQGATSLKYGDFVVFSREGFRISPTLVSGDTFLYRITVLEVPA